MLKTFSIFAHCWKLVENLWTNHENGCWNTNDLINWQKFSTNCWKCCVESVENPINQIFWLVIFLFRQPKSFVKYLYQKSWDCWKLVENIFGSKVFHNLSTINCWKPVTNWKQDFIFNQFIFSPYEFSTIFQQFTVENSAMHDSIKEWVALSFQHKLWKTCWKYVENHKKGGISQENKHSIL